MTLWPIYKPKALKFEILRHDFVDNLNDLCYTYVVPALWLGIIYIKTA